MITLPTVNEQALDILRKTVKDQIKKGMEKKKASK